MGSETDQTESKRDRVRRLVFEPLARRGFRFPKGIAPEDQRKAMDAMVDGVTYLSDDALRALEESLRSKGDGSAKTFWPTQATITTVAEALEQRPMRELPALLRWFGSRAGPEALAANRHVAEYLFWQRWKKPPVTDRDRRRVAEVAQEQADRAARVQDRIDRGFAPFGDDGQWLDWYNGLDARVRGYIAEAEKGDAA